MADRLYAHMFAGLVKRIGGVDAAAAVIEAHTGSMTKSTVSKMVLGKLSVTMEAVDALEDALNSHPLTRLRFERIGRNSGQTEPLASLVASACVECGEAMAALVGREMTSDEKAVALAEIAEALAALAKIKLALEQDQ